MSQYTYNTAATHEVSFI